jgi:uncharacterized membrane protein
MKKILTKEELRSLSEEIGKIEQKTSAEIRVAVRHTKHWSERKMTARQVAERDFVKLGMSKTEAGTGILIFILLSERKFELLADRGIVAVLPLEYWTEVAQKLSEHFSQSNFYHGLRTALAEIGKVLAVKLPRKEEAQDELPNDVVEE